MHFFNPAPIMKLVEISIGALTSKETFNIVEKLTASIHKTPVKVKDSPGFVVNRILIPMINEAILVYSSGVSSVEEIDSAMKLGANHPMGPLALADYIGLDVVLTIMEVLYSELKEEKYLAAPLLYEYISKGYLGRKSNRGFYNYRY